MRSCLVLESTPLPPLPSRVEVLLLQSLLKAHPGTVGTEGSAFQETLALILVDPPERLRYEVRALAASFVAARAEIHRLPVDADLPSWLRLHIAATPDSFLSLLVCAPTAERFEQLVPEAEGLPGALPGQLDLLLWIAPEAPPWDGDACGWIQGAGQDALGVVEILTSLMSPEMAGAGDVWDLREVLPGGPLRLIRAAWIADENRLHFASPNEAAWLEHSTTTVAAVQEASAFGDYGKVISCLKQHMRRIEVANLIVFTGCGLRTGLGMVGGILPLVMLVRVATSAGPWTALLETNPGPST